MKIYYYNGFYNDEFHTGIPEGAIEITDTLYHELLNGQSEGKQIMPPGRGHPYPWLETPELDEKSMIIAELNRIDASITPRTLREAALGDDAAIAKINEAEEKAEKLRKELKD